MEITLAGALTIVTCIISAILYIKIVGAEISCINVTRLLRQLRAKTFAFTLGAILGFAFPPPLFF